MNYSNKHIVITGGTSGIGLETVRKLAASNQMIVISRSGVLPAELSIGRFPVRLFHANLASKAEIELTVDQIQREFPVIDVLINNAAMQCTPGFLSDNFNYDAIQTEIDVNLSAVCHLCYLLLPNLLAANEGEIVNINSGLAIVPKTESAVYCATKSALDSFSKSLSYQLADTSVHVRQVFLPLVATPMTDGRGSGKLNASDVAKHIISGGGQRKRVTDVGKVKLLRLINYLLPPLARRIMKAG